MSDDTAHPRWAPRLSEYLDGDLDAADQALCEMHVATCAECRSTLHDLRGVIGALRVAPHREPTADLWPGIAQRIGAARGTRRLSFSVAQLIAASVALVLVGGGAAGLALRSRAAERDVATAVTPSARIVPSDPTIRPVVSHRINQPTLDESVAELQRMVDGQRGQLDTATVRVLERSLTTIDRAIADAQRAVATDPNNAYLSSYLARTKARKLALLRQAAALVAAS